jgi:hypothetical protein
MPDTSAEQGVMAEQAIISQSTLVMRMIIGRPHVMFQGIAGVRPIHLSRICGMSISDNYDAAMLRERAAMVD